MLRVSHLPLRLMDGILHPSIVSRGSIMAAIDCVWTLMDEGARLLNGAAPYEIIRLSVHISAVTRLWRGGGGRWGCCWGSASSQRRACGEDHRTGSGVFTCLLHQSLKKCANTGAFLISHSHYNGSHLMYHAFAIIKRREKMVWSCKFSSILH